MEKKHLKDLYPILHVGKESEFWRAIEHILNDKIEATRSADDNDSLDTWKKIGRNVGIRETAQNLLDLVNKEATMFLEMENKKNDSKKRR